MEHRPVEPQIVPEAETPLLPPSPNLVALSSFTPITPSYPRRLSSHFPDHPKLNHPIQPRAARQLSWVSLQGRLIGAEEATSAKAIGGNLGREEALAWELFSPIHRVLIVAVVSVAVANSKKNKQIHQLLKSVQLRDEILFSMQQKLDNLCEQVNVVKESSQPTELFTDCWLHDQHGGQSNDLLGNSAVKVASGDEVLKYRTPFFNGVEQEERRMSDFALSVASTSDIQLHNLAMELDVYSLRRDCEEKADAVIISSKGLATSKGNSVACGDEVLKDKTPFLNGSEQEERRMSDLSDFASSVASTSDIQLHNLAMELDVYNLRRDCEEKAAAVKELTAIIRSKDLATSKRIEELESIIRRKSSIINKLRKDMAVLEDKLVQLTREKRSSFSNTSLDIKEMATMRDNIVYDMDSATSPSSSESDCSPGKRKNASVIASSDNASIHSELTSEPSSGQDQKFAPSRISTSLVQKSQRHPTSHSPGPLTEGSMNHRTVQASLKPKLLSASGDIRKGKRQVHGRSKDATPHRRWI